MFKKRKDGHIAFRRNFASCSLCSASLAKIVAFGSLVGDKEKRRKE
jgi:hypothetical protein